MASPQKENGYTPIANEILDKIVTLKLNGTQYKIIILLWRYTYGFSRKQHELSETFVAKATWVHKTQIHKELNRLIEMKIVAVERESTFSAPRLLSFNKNYEEWYQKDYLVSNSLPPTKPTTTSGIKSTTTSGSKLATKDKQKAKNNIYREVFDYYNSLGLVKTKQYTDSIADAIKKAEKAVGNLESLKELMARHAKVVQISKDTGYAVRKRNIQTFLTQKVGKGAGQPFLYEEYMEGGKKYNYYLESEKPEEPPLPFKKVNIIRGQNTT